MNSQFQSIDELGQFCGVDAEELNAVGGGGIYTGLWDEKNQVGVRIGEGGISFRTADGQIGVARYTPKPS